ncbi:MAG: tRNA (N6-isopentenyl adenosine(37)-C2)-methylthiotransferase MiaB [Thermoleophilia bacterium]|jgi:tRNA-2-methylthio-N6-dimethylallyladenosine synthase|nr:tRNA (N6-isopentenyl adenosine(37)-C2)-methylthiotransferase MiaB [Thermoleophilia bacterium]
MRTYYLRSFGCQMNEHDAERLRHLLEAEGLAPVGEPEAADVLVYNTCTVRESADERLAGHLSGAGRLKREDPERVVLVTGCLPQAEGAAFFARFPFVDGILGPQNVHRLPELLEAAVARGAPAEGRPAFVEDGPHMSGELPGRRARPFQAWVQVMSGCTNFCSYCIVPYVRGPERSRRPAAIAAEVHSLVADGVREVTLLGQNVNAYGRDLSGAGEAGGGEASDFPALLARLDGVDGLDRLRFVTSHPRDLSERLIDAVAELPSVCEHVHLPLQSGSDRILGAMRRGYTAEAFLGLVRRLRAAVPDVSVTTDLIAGFPGESEDDFAATLAAVEEAAFDAAFTFVYSPRRGTAAAELPGQVPEDVRRERVTRLIEVTQGLALAAHRRWVGRRVEVLVEGPSRHAGGVRGRTRQHVTVNFGGAAAAGTIVEVEITGATSTTLAGRR